MEAIEQARAFLKETTVTDYYEKILLGALRLAQADAELGRLDDVRLENIFKTVSEIIEDLAEHGNEAAPDAKAKLSAGGKVVSLTGAGFGKPVFCIPGLGRLDDCAVLVVADSLKRAGIDARTAGATTAIEDGEAASVCICYLENVSKPRIDYAVRKLSRMAPSARIVICLLNEAEPSGHSAPQQQATPRSLGAVVAAFADRENRSASIGN
jgi:nucleotide-binding universal stress UspA family protein